jgi:hypothetical protein
MKKPQLLKILNLVLAGLLVFQFISALLPSVVPYEWHRAGGILLGIGVGLHLFLNWPWIRANYLKR